MAATKQEKIGPVWFVFKCALWFLVCVVLGIVLEWVIMTIYYPEQGAYRSLRLLEAELSYLESSDLISTGYGSRLIRSLLTSQHQVYAFVSQTLMLERALVGVSEASLIQYGFSRLGLLAPQVYAVSMLNMLNVITLRVVVVILCLPVFFIVLIWATSIGLTQRAIRKHQVRPESSWIFHHAKRIKFWSLVLPIVIYLAWPNELSPLLVFGPCAFFYGMAWLVMASKFKKNW